MDEPQGHFAKRSESVMKVRTLYLLQSYKVYKETEMRKAIAKR